MCTVLHVHRVFYSWEWQVISNSISPTGETLHWYKEKIEFKDTNPQKGRKQEHRIGVTHEKQK